MKHKQFAILLLLTGCGGGAEIDQVANNHTPNDGGMTLTSCETAFNCCQDSEGFTAVKLANNCSSFLSQDEGTCSSALSKAHALGLCGGCIPGTGGICGTPGVCQGYFVCMGDGSPGPCIATSKDGGICK